jgi:hypothetical protein
MTHVSRQTRALNAVKATVIRGAEYASERPKTLGADSNVIAAMRERSEADRQAETGREREK